MKTMFYPELIPVPGNYLADYYVVHAYDPANGLRWTPSYAAPKSAFIYHSSIHVNGLYETEEEALRMCGEWSRRKVKMPDGSTIIPVEYFHPEYALESVFIPWSAVRGELWPGEY